MHDMRALIAIVEQTLQELAPRGKLDITPQDATDALNTPVPAQPDGSILDDPYHAFRSMLLKRGFTLHGEGAFGIVFEHPSYDYVIKVFNTTEDFGYVKFVKYCNSHHGNPHLPVFRGKIMKIDDDHYCNRIERLEEVPSDLSGVISDAVDYIELMLNKLKPPTMDGMMRHLGKIYDQHEIEGPGCTPEFLQTLIDLAIVSVRQGYGFDVHDGNVMCRQDGTPVIIDPFAGNDF